MARALPSPPIDVEDEIDLDYPYFVDPDEGRRMFDEAVRETMGISGEEFIRRWEAGEYWEIADRPGSLYIGNLIALIPFARQ
ncbi:MAG: hypothetical protein ACRDJW_18800 [Thermomicrobiales bacterium]